MMAPQTRVARGRRRRPALFLVSGLLMVLAACGGEFDADARSYESNIIVFGSLVGSRAT